MKKRGFGAMDPERLRELARQGGKAVHAKGAGHEFTSEEARIAGRKGGIAASADRAHMAELGRRGGIARAKQRRAEERDACPDTLPAPAADDGATS